MSLPDSHPPNPYQPPVTPAERVLLPKPPGRVPRVWAILLGAGGSLAYFGFIVVLLRSTGPDRIAGLVFMVNLIIPIGFGIWEIIRRSVVWRSYAGLTCGQFLILAGMLAVGFGSASPVIIINLMIAGIAASLATASWVIGRLPTRRRPTDTPRGVASHEENAGKEPI